MSDLTVIYLTANVIDEYFALNMQKHLLKSIGDSHLISVSKKPMDFGDNIVVDTSISHLNIYRQALVGAKAAKTPYIAIAEDDTLYHADHFRHRPKDSKRFAYNTACWSIYSWSEPPIYSYSGRRNHNVLICDRNLYIEAIEERFAKWPDDSKIDITVWAEPGKYESHLGVTPRKTEMFYSDPACIMFSHPKGLSHNTLGLKKRLAPIRAYEIPYWGRAEDVIKLHHLP